MSKKIDYAYQPDFVTPPGDTLSEVLDNLGLSQVELAKRMGRTPKAVNELIKGIVELTPETALILERVLNIPSSFWSNRERAYRDFVVRDHERKALETCIDWLKKVPLKEMVSWGWIPKVGDPVGQLTEVVNFFGLASIMQWDEYWLGKEAVFRKSKAFQAEPIAVSAWLRKGEMEGRRRQCRSFNMDRFKEFLLEARQWTTLEPEEFVPRLIAGCANSGVALVFLRELPKTRVYGATQWLSPTKALMQLSLRGKSNDHLWFTFFHEAGHIILHGKREVFVESNQPHDEKERKADEFARDLLISKQEYESLVGEDSPSYGQVREFSNKTGIAPGIVVGRLQHDKVISFHQYNGLKVSYGWEA